MRLLVAVPSWVGDAAMATPALRLLRSRLHGSFIGGLVRPGIDQVLAGTDFFDQLHVERARGVMGPKVLAARVRPLRYDTALLLTNSFSSALVARLAFIPRRVGYDRDGRGVLLTDKLEPARRARPHKGFAPMPAVDYYLAAAHALLGERESKGASPALSPPALELAVTDQEQHAAAEILAKGGAAQLLDPGGLGEAQLFAILNPGGNNPAKRWPADRFAEIGARLVREHRMSVLINGSPAEAELVAEIADCIRAKLGSADTGTASAPPILELPKLGITIGALKALIHRAGGDGGILVTNDTGPRHLAAAFRVPTVSLFGPTDPRWTTLPGPPSPTWEHPRKPSSPREVVLVSDPTLPPEEVADDHPERCRVDRIEVKAVWRAVESLL
ncbi:MAG: glycosyltransferase family 9 protein [Phycisphaerales bacterium]|nr:glycosyltransferase family 9 protein [Phycisphaerales bacterium]